MIKTATRGRVNGVPSLALATASLCLIAGFAIEANAVSARVKSACKSDYFQFCPSYAVDTPQLRACMRQVGRGLSPRCLDALYDAGEIRRKRR